ncbi:MAG: hypothetical protein ABR611_12965, partial [Chthoniobacterales bacterium]
MLLQILERSLNQGNDERIFSQARRLHDQSFQFRIGEVVSDALLDRFGTVRRVFAASERELLRAPGVG